jgi:hypothetical protein
MKNVFYTNWTAFFAVFTLMFNLFSLSDSEAGGQQHPKQKNGFFANLAANAQQRKAERQQQMPAPTMQTESAKQPVLNSPRAYPCCTPTCVKTRVVEREVIVYKDVVKEVIIERPVYVEKEVVTVVKRPVFVLEEEKIVIKVPTPVYEPEPYTVKQPYPVYVPEPYVVTIPTPVYEPSTYVVTIPTPVYQPQVRPQCPPGQRVVYHGQQEQRLIYRQQQASNYHAPPQQRCYQQQRPPQRCYQQGPPPQQRYYQQRPPQRQLYAGNRGYHGGQGNMNYNFNPVNVNQGNNVHYQPNRGNPNDGFRQHLLSQALGGGMQMLNRR